MGEGVGNERVRAIDVDRDHLAWDPRKVDLVDLARDPKDAALEFELRWSMKAWEGALELAKAILPAHEAEAKQKGIDVKIDKQTIILLKGIDKRLVGQTAAILLYLGPRLKLAPRSEADRRRGALFSWL